MRSYRSYQRIDPIYFGGEIFFPVGLVLVAAIISYGLLFVFGLFTALFFNVFIAWCGYFYVYYYGKSKSKITFEFLTVVFLITLLLLFVDYGVYALVEYQKTGAFNQLYFAVWLSILLGFPAVYYIHLYSSHYYAKKRLADTYFKTSLSVYHDRELLTHIDSIVFINSSKKLISDIKIQNDNCFYSEKELAAMETSSKYYHLKKSAFSSLIHIPFNADQFEMSWYSIIEDQYYDVNVPFPFHKLILEEEKYPVNESKSIRGKKSKRLLLHIYQNGGFKLYNEDIILLDYYTNPTVAIEDSIKQVKLIANQKCHNYYNNTERFLELIKELKWSNTIAKRQELQDKLVVWNLKFSGLHQGHYIEIADAYFKNHKLEKDGAFQSALRHLPVEITFVYRGSYLFPWMTLHIDTLKLNECIEEIKKEDSDEVSFLLHFKNTAAHGLEFIVKANENETHFDAWEIVIDERHKKEMDEDQQEQEEEVRKRALLKEAWDFVFAKNYKEAQKNCEALLALDPQYGFAYFLEARLLWYTKGFEACYSKRDYFFAKTAHEPAALAHIYNSFGCILDLELRYEESIPYFEKAIEINPKEPIYICNLGEMYYKVKDPANALKEAKKAKRMGYESDILTEILSNNGKIDLINH
ncbi:tetratricopeptide repeat protein [Flavobacterium artemisiae]|uniref:Tetratricopeptide repeat protein n=1 Tax=Flavobacterium artemisiae TaxID=2126556 RepID=A0ABW4HK10_9FLAO